MSHSSADYSELINAILREDGATSDKLASELVKRVTLYLRVRMGAPASVAEECAYQAFSAVFEKIRTNQIIDRQSVFKYLIIAARNEYIHFKKKEEKTDLTTEDRDDNFPVAADQMQNLIDRERQQLLKKCINKLSKINRSYILNFFTHPQPDMQVLADEFGFSYSKARTLKTRIIQELQKCVQKSIR